MCTIEKVVCDLIEDFSGHVIEEKDQISVVPFPMMKFIYAVKFDNTYYIVDLYFELDGVREIDSELLSSDMWLDLQNQK